MRSDVTHVLIIDDLAAYRSAFAMVLERENDFRVVGQVDSIAGARRALNRLHVQVDIALIAMKLPDGPGMDAIPEINAISPGCHIAMLRAGWNKRDDALAVAAGAGALFPRSATISDIVSGFRTLRSGSLLIPQEHRIAYLEQALTIQAEQHAALSALSRLTPREWEILRELANGKSDKETAEEWGVSRKTVAAHMANLLDKLKVESRLQAVLLALRYHVVDLE